MVLMNILFT